MLDHFNRLMSYELWANARVNDSLLSAKRALEHGGASAEAPALIRAGEIWAHVQCARAIWLHRLGVGEPPPELFPRWTVERAITHCHEMDGTWPAYVATLTEADLPIVRNYRTTEGAAKTTVLADILTHVFNHATYHRGQIARLVTDCGGKRADTDFIIFARKDA
jgi:uncharacterized damage-inducible protein DinB